MSRTSVRLTVLFGTLAALLFSGATATNAQRPANADTEQVNGNDAVAREVLVKFRSAPQANTLNAIQSLADAALIEPVGRTGVRRIRSRSFNATALLRMLANRPDVLYAEPNYIVHALTEPNDPAFPQLWGLRNTGQAVNGSLPGVAGADIRAAQAWDVSVGSTAQVVAVVDTGIDYTHPDLAANMWSAPAPFVVTLGGVPIACPAGTHGFNAITLTCNPMDDHHHGTHVSGTIGAFGNNGVGVVGVNWITQIMGIKFLDATGSGSEADAINGIEFAIQAKEAFAGTGGANVRVLSNSWGGTAFTQALLDEINAANDADMLFVAAAGNTGFDNDIYPIYPASYDAPNIMSVAATTNTDEIASFSSYSANSVHLGAPGVDVLSTVPGNSVRFSQWNLNGHASCVRGCRACVVAMRLQYRCAEGHAAKHSRASAVVSVDYHHRRPPRREQCNSILHCAASAAGRADGACGRRPGDAPVVRRSGRDQLQRETKPDVRRAIYAAGIRGQGQGLQ